MNARPVYSVTQINNYIKGMLDSDRVLTGVFIRGEISNYKVYPSGHHYFSLKDEGGAIRCVLFRREASSLRFRPQSGMMVVAYGRITVFPRDGAYQLYVSVLQPDGVGDLHVAFEQLKARLSAEGLFDLEHKKPLPKYPKRIALVTSPAGAAVRDMLRILGARWPMAEAYVVPCRVQGAEAPAEIAGAIAWVNAYRLADLIITGRGGGSMEDLWCFNDEGVARAIYASEIPVISAVGHEPDVTIADYVADLRAATPSNAAELAVPDQNEEYARLDYLKRRLAKAGGERLRQERIRLDRFSRCRALQDPMTWVQDRRVLLDYQRDRLTHALTAALGEDRERFARLAASLDALSPLKVLSRGYAIARGPLGVVRSVKDAAPGDELNLKVSDGDLSCTVNGRADSPGKGE